MSKSYTHEQTTERSSSTVIENSKSARRSDDPIVQCKLGDCYQYGLGVTQDYNKAFGWYLKSANNGNAEGQNKLGYCYIKGFGTDKNSRKAFELFLKSANNGHAQSQNNLGNCYLNGIGTDKNFVKPFKWFTKSANNECVEVIVTKTCMEQFKITMKHLNGILSRLIMIMD